MDIWAWVENLHDELNAAGHKRVADLLYRIPNDLHENRVSQVEAALPEALAAARSMKNPWMEVFFRHWGLQNRVSNLSEGASALPEAVSLMEFAHRDETISCPQSICATHDIVICYGNTDGPGWVPERLETCTETLARMEPSRNCYDCISREYASALQDDNRPEEALVYLDQQADKMKQAGNTLSVAYQEVQARALRQVGRHTEALALLQRIEDAHQDDDDDGDRISRAVARARILAEMDRFDEAWETLPAWSDITPQSYLEWSAAIAILAVKREGSNSWQLGRILQEAMDHMQRVGAYRRLITIAERHARLAITRGAAWTARRALSTAQSVLPKLRAPCGAIEQLAALKNDIDKLPAVAPLPVPAEKLLEHLQQQEERNPEQDIEWLLAASAQRPDDAELAEVTASAMAVCNAKEEAQAYLWAFVQAHPEREDGPVFQLLSLLIDADQDTEVQRLATFMEAHQPKHADWCKARLAFKRERWSEVGEHVQNLIARMPEALGARRLWAQAAMNMQDFATAVRLRQELVHINETQHKENSDEELNRNDHWDLLTAASAAQDWKTVRHIAASLGMELTEGESENSPVEEEWGWVRLRYFEDGEWQEYFGQRTGPVTARVYSVAPPRRVQHVRDWVVFDAQMLEAAPEDEKEREDFIAPYRVVHTLKTAGYTGWFVDGAHPGDEAYAALRDAVQARDWSIWTGSRSDYTVQNPQEPDGEALPGLYFFIATPPQLSAAEADVILTKLTAHWKHPACWLGLAQAAGQSVEKHQQIIEQYGL